MADDKIIIDPMPGAKELHNKLMAVLFGADVLQVAIHGQILRRTLQELNPGVWEKADEILKLNSTQEKAGH